MIKSLLSRDILDSLYTKKIYIQILQYLKAHREKNSGSDFKPSKQMVINELKNFNYNEDASNDALQILSNSGYVIKIKDKSFVIITDEGEEYLKNYHQYIMLNNLEKFTIIVKKRFTAVLSLSAFIISVISLIFSFFK